MQVAATQNLFWLTIERMPGPNLGELLCKKLKSSILKLWSVELHTCIDDIVLAKFIVNYFRAMMTMPMIKQIIYDCMGLLWHSSNEPTRTPVGFMQSCCHWWTTCHLHPFWMMCHLHPFRMTCHLHPFWMTCHPHPFWMTCHLHCKETGLTSLKSQKQLTGQPDN